MFLWRVEKNSSNFRLKKESALFDSSTLSSLAASGLKVGVLIYCKNNVDILFLRPSRLVSFTPLINRSASRSINSIIS